MSRADRIALAFLGLHPERCRSLVERFGSAGAAVRAARRGAVEGIAPGEVWSPEKSQEALGRARCRAVLLGDDDYPVSLGGIGDPPPVLFVQGTLPDAAGVGVVGTRRCTGYGRRLAEAYGRAIAAAGWATVSGLARGIDGAAHTGTAAVQGVGVAVLGSGIDVVYPAEHRRLLDRLLDAGGAVVSEYPPGTRPNGWRFPPRNRIISGLSAAVVVVESGITGGALVTAARAAEQGREVLATPGDVDRESSIGCNLLIRDGAIPVLGPDDLVEALSLVPGLPFPQRPRVSASDPADPAGSIPATGVSIEELAATLAVDGPELLSLLGRLALEGRVRLEGDRVMPGAPA